jgi:hypothetical protein
VRSDLGHYISQKLYLSSWYLRLKQRMDASRRAIIALVGKILFIIYIILKTNQFYNEQKFLERKEATNKKRIRCMVNELTRLGYVISIAA